MFRKVSAEFIGSAILLMSVIGSGIMATNQSQDFAIQLIINMLSIVSTLIIIIFIFGPISGSHFNPLVTLVELFHKRINVRTTIFYILAQFSGALLGTALANIMFNKPIYFPSHHIRSGANIFLSEVIATAGLIVLIEILRFQGRLHFAPIIIPAWITAGFFFTSSFIFVNPSVTFARAWSESFSGIAPSSVPMFVVAQILGTLIGILGSKAFSPKE